MHYRWRQSNSQVKDVEFVALHQEQEAIIYAPEGMSREALQQIPDALRDQGMVATPDVVKGEYVLRVQHFGTRERFLRTLEQSGFTQGAPEHFVTEFDKKPEEPASLMERVKKDSVRASGVLYLAGDALLAVAGLLRGDAAEAATGLIWGSTGAVLTLYGKKDPDVQDKILYNKLSEFFHKEGLNLSVEGNEQGLQHLAGEHGLAEKAKEFLYDHPVEFNNTLQAGGGLLMAKSGFYNQRNEKGTPNYYKTAAGLMVATGQTAGMVVDAKPRDKDEPEPQVGSIDWFHEKPLRITGVLAFSNNLSGLAGAALHDQPYNKHIENVMKPEVAELIAKSNGAAGLTYAEHTDLIAKQKKVDSFEGIVSRDEHGKVTKTKMGDKQAVKFNVGAAFCYMAANALYGMSSKDTSVSLKDIGKLDEVYAVVAHVIGAQSPDVQQGMVERVAGYLSTQPDVNQTADDIAKELRMKMRQMEHNPWASNIPEKSVQYPVYQQRAAGTVIAPTSGMIH